MAWHIRSMAIAHDIADGPRGARPASQHRNVSVRCDPAGRDAPDDRQHTSGKRSFVLHAVLENVTPSNAKGAKAAKAAKNYILTLRPLRPLRSIVDVRSF